MNKKICDALLWIMVFALIFTHIPKAIQWSFLGSGMSGRLSWYPLVIGLLYTGYCQWKYKNVLVYWSTFRNFIVVYLGIALISEIWGLWIYPYYDNILNGPVSQIEKMQYVLHWAADYGILIDEKWLTGIWMIARPIKVLILTTLYTWCGAYMIFCWYYNRAEDLKRILIKGLWGSLIVVVLYSGIEIFYLLGSETAKGILMKINPFLYDIKTNYGWWPPLLWKNQLRSVFPEPSFFSIWSAFAFPLLIFLFFEKGRQKYLWGSILLIFSCMIFLTNARTGVALLLGELGLFGIYIIWNHSVQNLKRYGCVLGILCLAFYGAMTIEDFKYPTIQNEISQKDTIKENVSEYVDKNLTSIVGIGKRSNAARYGTIWADAAIGLDHPLLGVGNNLVSAYKPDYFPKWALENKEVQLWIKYQESAGILKYGIPSFSEYTRTFAEGGIFFFVARFGPVVYLLFRLMSEIYKKKGQFWPVCLLVSLCGMLASGLSNNLSVTYCFWILLAAGYVLCFGNSETNRRGVSTIKYE